MEYVYVTIELRMNIDNGLWTLYKFLFFKVDDSSIWVKRLSYWFTPMGQHEHNARLSKKRFYNDSCGLYFGSWLFCEIGFLEIFLIIYISMTQDTIKIDIF